LSDEDLAGYFYLEGIARMMSDDDMEGWRKQFADVMARDFATTWGFEIIEDWLEEATITEEKKEFILEITEQFKKHL